MIDTEVPSTQTRQQLQTIVRKEASFDQKAREVLEVGVEYLDMDYGYQTRIDPETNHWEVVITTDSKAIPAGQQRVLEDTYCRETITTDTHYALHDAPAQGWANDTAVQSSEHHAYLGFPLVVNTKLVGTVCFVAEEPRSDRFTDTQIWFIEHLSRLLEQELARDHVEAKLTNQTNFANVLHRVLRHNLRNDISVIRGYTEAVADQVEDESILETVFDHIDGLLEISNKARKLQKIISSSTERKHTEVGGLVEEIVDDIAQEHPEASISVECDEKLHVSVLQHFDQAVKELVENAVKHSGDSPNVTVTIDSVPNAFQICIVDDGPGLPEEEAEVLTAGKETKLAHGSGLGLWLVYWIVTSHEGSISAEPTTSGTTMSITIPRKPDASVQQQLTELSRSRDRYKSTFDEAADAMIIADDEGRCIEANDSAADLLALSKKEIPGRKIADFTPDDVDFESAWQQFRTKGTDQGTFRIVRPDGSERVVDYAATADIVPGEHLSIARDVTKREEHKQERAALKNQYRALLEAAPDPVFVANADTGKIIEVNDAAQAILGKPREEIVGHHQSQLHPANKREQYRQLFDKSVNSEEPQRHLPDGSPVCIVTADREQIPVEIIVETVTLPQEPVIFGIFREISGSEPTNQQ